MPVDLDELERLEREATPGPWRITIKKVASGEWEYQLSAERGRAAMPYSDFTLIAAARNALPDLIVELRTLRARVAELERDARLGAAVREAVERVEDDHVAGHLVVVSATERSAYDEDDIVITEDKLDVLRAIDRVLAEEEEADDAS